MDPSQCTVRHLFACLKFKTVFLPVFRQSPFDSTYPCFNLFVKSHFLMKTEAAAVIDSFMHDMLNVTGVNNGHSMFCLYIYIKMIVV